ncbi:carboxylesterase [Bacillus thuringiensis]|nr:carboxylesterase [Bacillus thuringiensis]PFQ21306.1 carboxylesterase [Bacillus cereus]PGA22436.1 carboxylesterase [Bacillus thuringiensis]PGR73280.1 carboxylesterase [Bacillus cereus]BCA35399.1 hypothetical protein BwiPL1_37810 [Bacillus wiedmannii]
MKRHDNKIGHFTSEEGKEDFQIAYDESMALLPKPNDTKDIKTKYGTIRAYYFTKEENKHKEPILLLPGRGASTPMWVPNLEGLRENASHAINGEFSNAVNARILDFVEKHSNDN